MGDTQPELQATNHNPGGSGGGVGARFHRPTTVVIAITAAAVVIAAVALLIGGGGHTATFSRTATPSARTARPSTRLNTRRVDPSTTSNLSAFASTAPAGVDAPPPDRDPSGPGQEVEGGADQSDPFLLLDGTRYFLYTSGIPGPPTVNVPVTSATRFGSWGPVTDALPDLPPWVAAGFTWAPDVQRFGTTYVLYFTALVRNSHPAMECIGDAVGTSASGPFRPLRQPFICQPTLGGDIDPRVIVSPDGVPFMLWKSDQNIGGSNTPTQMWSQHLAGDGLTLTGRPALLLMPDQPWEATIVEAPDMVEVGDAYWLVFSGNWYNGPNYAIGAARCDSPQGPCVDLGQNPLLGSNAQGSGPGEPSLFADSAGVWMLYSPWHSLAPHPDFPRPVDITRLGFDAAGPYLAAGGPPPPLYPLPLGPTMWQAPVGRSAP
jgi:hypothetical protein